MGQNITRWHMESGFPNRIKNGNKIWKPLLIVFVSKSTNSSISRINESNNCVEQNRPKWNKMENDYFMKENIDYFLFINKVEVIHLQWYYDEFTNVSQSKQWQVTTTPKLHTGNWCQQRKMRKPKEYCHQQNQISNKPTTKKVEEESHNKEEVNQFTTNWLLNVWKKRFLFSGMGMA